MSNQEVAKQLSERFAQLYFYCHPKFEIELSHQAVRAMQFISITGPATVQQISEHLGSAHNTASEIVRRLRDKGFVLKRRCRNDERVVEVYLTDLGEDVLLQHTGLDITQLAKGLKEMSEQDKQVVQQAFDQLIKVIKENPSC